MVHATTPLSPPLSLDSTDDATLSLPRILCLHGGGVNAEVFRLQMRAIISRLRPRFRLVFADGPFISSAHPAIVPVYGDPGPFRRWLRWLPEHAEISAEDAAEAIRSQVRKAMEDDNRTGATGEWVGLLGFSQGAKIVASLLLAQQTLQDRALLQPKTADRDVTAVRWKFGVIIAGRTAPVRLDERIGTIRGVQEASGLGDEFQDWPYLDLTAEKGPAGERVLRIPTVHIHGLKDPGLHLHQRLLDEYCAAGSAAVVEWDGDHRIPIKRDDVQAVAGAILELADRLGIS